MDDQSLSFRLVAILFPIFAIVAAGYFYGRKHKPEMAVANRINMDVFVPAVVFAAMAGKSFDVQAYAPLALGALLVLLTCGLLAWPIARLLGMEAKTLVPPMMFNNSGNIGLPLAVLAWGEQALPAAVIMFMVENTLHFTFGARLLDPHARLLTLWRVPVVFAAITGLAVALLKIQIWSPAITAIKMLGDVSVPLLLFSLGVRMTDVSFSEWKVAVGSALLRPLAGMAIAYGVIALLGIEGRNAAMLLVFGAFPPAVLNFLFAERYKQEPQRVASIVLIGNLAALIFLPLALALVL
ncbi:AEC family transporter [Dechloromonas sp. XY25]|uniref:AEC family transporter n=1 Tax=Dechloromonas hankyongensis TaxID=2908002 RepID=A0ABS9JYN6_9RHOO|nr:AEC family transporter [Dechloromonas hankyongensis]MCG2576027.1 AEC family transporter [Dechloromonas hankyongensis]